MKLSLSLLFAAIALVNVDAAEDSNTFSCLDPAEVDYNHDYFPDKVSPEFSRHWSISYHNTYKIFKNTYTGTSWLLYQCGTTPPASEEGKHQGMHKVPLQNGLALSTTTDLTHLEQLGLRRQVKGMVGGTAYIGSPCFKQMADEGIIDSVNGGWYSSGLDRADFEEKHPEVVFINSVGDAPNDLHVTGSSEAESKDIYEWHKVFGALFNQEKMANEEFTASVDRYDCAADNAAYLVETRTARKLKLDFEKAMATPLRKKEENNKRKLGVKPKLLWASHTKYGYDGSNYNLPAWDIGDCSTINNYYCEFATQCQAEIMHANTGSILADSSETNFHKNFTEFMEFAKDAEYWIYPAGNFNATLYEFPELRELDVVKNGQVYDNEKTLSTWFEHRISEYDIVLQDLCDIVEHNDPTRLPHTRQYFRKVLPEDEAESKTTLGVCAEGEVDQEWETRASQCSSLRPIGDSGDSHDHEDHDSHDHEDSSASSFMTADTVSSIAIIAATVIASVF